MANARHLTGLAEGADMGQIGVEDSKGVTYAVGMRVKINCEDDSKVRGISPNGSLTMKLSQNGCCAPSGSWWGVKLDYPAESYDVSHQQWQPIKQVILPEEALTPIGDWDIEWLQKQLSYHESCLRRYMIVNGRLKQYLGFQLWDSDLDVLAQLNINTEGLTGK